MCLSNVTLSPVALQGFPELYKDQDRAANASLNSDIAASRTRFNTVTKDNTDSGY